MLWTRRVENQGDQILSQTCCMIRHSAETCGRRSTSPQGGRIFVFCLLSGMAQLVHKPGLQSLEELGLRHQWCPFPQVSWAPSPPWPKQWAAAMYTISVLLALMHKSVYQVFFPSWLCDGLLQCVGLSLPGCLCRCNEEVAQSNKTAFLTGIFKEYWVEFKHNISSNAV